MARQPGPGQGGSGRSVAKYFCLQRPMKTTGIVSVASLQLLPRKEVVQNTGRIRLVCLPLEQGEAAQLWFNQKQEAGNLLNQVCQDRALTTTLLHHTSATGSFCHGRVHTNHRRVQPCRHPGPLWSPGTIARYGPSPVRGGSPGSCWSPPQPHLQTCLSSLTTRGAQSVGSQL